MRTTLLCISLLLGITVSSQTFEWQWAKRGGGIKQTPAESDMASGDVLLRDGKRGMGMDGYD